MNICIFGASGRELEESYYAAAELLGSLIAQQGHTLVFGGGREGLMGAAARGAHKYGGDIIGIVPKFFDEPGIIYEHCTELIFTETVRERKQLMEERSEACVVLPGGIGTLEEFFEMLTLKQLGRSDRAIVVLNTNNYYDPMQHMLEDTARQRFMSRGCLELYGLADTPDKALDYIARYVPRKGSIRRLEDYNK